MEYLLEVAKKFAAIHPDEVSDMVVDLLTFEKEGRKTDSVHRSYSHRVFVTTVFADHRGVQKVMLQVFSQDYSRILEAFYEFVNEPVYLIAGIYSKIREHTW